MVGKAFMLIDKCKGDKSYLKANGWALCLSSCVWLTSYYG